MFGSVHYLHQKLSRYSFVDGSFAVRRKRHGQRQGNPDIQSLAAMRVTHYNTTAKGSEVMSIS